jgi:hypothetical protein
MAKPIDLKLVLEEEDARIFMEGFNHPQITQKKVDMFKKAREIYKNNRV